MLLLLHTFTQLAAAQLMRQDEINLTVFNKSLVHKVGLSADLCVSPSVRRDHPGPQQHVLRGHRRAQHSQHARRLQPVGRDEEEEELQPHEQEGSRQDAGQHRDRRQRAQVLHAG